MKRFEFSELAAKREQSGKLYLEFLKVPSMSMGIYSLKAGAVDPQKPHSEDEVYYIVSGHGKFCVGSEDQEVASGSIVFVGASVEHRFHSITEDLQILVFFAPAEYSNKK